MLIDDREAEVAAHLSGLALFYWCQALARQYRRSFREQKLFPSGARVWYYCRLILLREGNWPPVELTEESLPPEVVERFRHQAFAIAERLKTEYSLAVRLLVNPYGLLSQWLADDLLPGTAPLRQALDYLERLPRNPLIASPEQGMPAGQRPPLLDKVSPARVLVAPVARPQHPDAVALRLLRARLAQDAITRGWIVPPPEVYLYDEPLVCWCARLLEKLGSEE